MRNSQRGTFATNSKALGDIKVSALFPPLGVPAATADVSDELTLKAGISIPTGSTEETAQILTPMAIRSGCGRPTRCRRAADRGTPTRR